MARRLKDIIIHLDYEDEYKDGKVEVNIIASEPEELIRCKDCKWWELVDDYYAKGYGECTCPSSVIKRSSFLNEDWYCADGERKEE